MTDTHTVAVVIIGAEVLSGKVEDANGPYLIRELRARGAKLGELRVIDDGVEVIARTVAELASRFDSVITTGGIGPTHDDLTVAGVASAFEVAVVRDPTLERALERFYGDDLTENHLRLADVPDGATIHRNEALMPTIQMRNVFVLPGVPSLMRGCFKQVAHRFQGPEFITWILYLNAREAEIADALSRAQATVPGVSIGSYPRFDSGPARVKVTVESTDAALVERALVQLRDALPESSILEEKEESLL